MPMPAYEYKIGVTQAGLVTLASLGVPAPRHAFEPFARRIVLGSGGAKGHGFPQDDWSWGFLTQDQRAALRTYVPDAGANIYVRDLKDDGVTWADFECHAYWPQSEDRQAGRRLQFTLLLRYMIELEDL